MKINFLGSGTSMGVPMLGCKCEVCRSTDPRDKRLRTSAWIEIENKHIIIDSSTDFRQQLLREKVPTVDAILFTHHHADHIFGLDDVRPFNLIQKKTVEIFASEHTMPHLRRIFNYALEGMITESDVPRLNPVTFTDAPFSVLGIKVQPIPMWHGKTPVTGFRIGNFAWCTDVSEIPPDSFDLLKNLDVLVLGALRTRPHPTHFTVGQAVEAAGKINARETYLVHMSHGVSHKSLLDTLPDNIFPSYDGLELQLDL